MAEEIEARAGSADGAPESIGGSTERDTAMTDGDAPVRLSYRINKCVSFLLTDAR